MVWLLSVVIPQLHNLCLQVDWSSEKKCFCTFAQECGSLYSIQYDPFLHDSMGTSADQNTSTSLYKKTEWQWTIEHVLLAALRSKLIPPCSLAQNGSILQIASLHELYKVFERC